MSFALRFADGPEEAGEEVGEDIFCGEPYFYLIGGLYGYITDIPHSVFLNCIA
jgi:hypothetical protein